MIRLRKLLLSALIVGVTGLIAGAASWSAFSSTTSNPSNTFQAGSVSLSDNDGGNALLSLTNAMPGATTTGCIKVTYGGSLDSTVKLYATVSGDLAQYLTLKVTRGTDSGTYPTCNFTPDTRDYTGNGAGVIYNGNLSAYPTTYGAGITDPENSTGGTETWTGSPNETHAYKLEVTLQNNSAAQGKSATASFTWEARNQ